MKTFMGHIFRWLLDVFLWTAQISIGIHIGYALLLANGPRWMEANMAGIMLLVLLPMLLGRGIVEALDYSRDLRKERTEQRARRAAIINAEPLLD